MVYINALHLINLCVKSEILKEQDGGVFVYREAGEKHPEGWYLEDKDILAKELMKDKEGQDFLIKTLKEKGVDYAPVFYNEKGES